MRQPTARIVVATASLFVIVAWISVIWQIEEDRATAIRSALRENRSRVVAFEQYVRRTLEAADLAASYLDVQYGPGAHYGGPTEANGETRPRLIALPGYYRPVITGAEIADRDGRIRVTTKQGGPVNVKDRRVFRELRAVQGVARAISNPAEPPGSTQAELLIARSLIDGQGRFAGAVAVDVPAHRFVDFNNGLRYRPDDLISIVSLRGIVLVRRQGDTVSWGQDLQGDLALAHQRADPDGEYWAKSASDGKRHLYSHQRLAAYPIFVTSGMGEDDLLGPARWRAGWFLSLATALTLVVGALLALFFRHIHNEQQAQRRFDVIRDEFAHSARVASMNEMAAGLAHELNQPLSAAANFLAAGEYILNGDGDRAGAAAQLQQARGQIGRAGKIIRRIRDYLAKGTAELRVELIDDTIQDAIELARGANVAPRARIVYAGARPPARALIDRIQIQQVLVNLIRNAEEAMAEIPPERRAIRIGSEIASADFLKVTVEDAGPGIPDAVFHRFKLPFISTKGQDGLGIGLSICRRIIEAHGGELEAHNLASGAEVWFTVPLAPAAGATG